MSELLDFIEALNKFLEEYQGRLRDDITVKITLLDDDGFPILMDHGAEIYIGK